MKGESQTITYTHTHTHILRENVFLKCLLCIIGRNVKGINQFRV